MEELLRECVHNFGAAPREASWWERFTYLEVRKPLLFHLARTDRMNILFLYQRALLQNGVVVWGHIVQANSLMYGRGPLNSGGEVVYSLEDPHAADPVTLQRIAHDLFALKGTEPDDPDEAVIARHLTSEMSRAFGFPVPSSISPTVPCRISSTFFARKHLPQRRICKLFFPLIVNPVKPYVALPLPARFWPKALVEWWSR